MKSVWADDSIDEITSDQPPVLLDFYRRALEQEVEELSAEIELMDRDKAARQWKHETHTLNQWGVAWMRN